MHGLLKAGLLLAPALAGAAATSQDNNPSAFITLDLPVAALENGTPFLSLRLDVLESPSACGSANVTINGEALPKNGKLALPLVPDFDGANGIATSKKNTPSAVVSWESDCVSWGGMEREQIMRLRVVSVNGVDAKKSGSEDDVTTIRFTQTSPARIIVAEGTASAFYFNDNYYAETDSIPTEADDADNDEFEEITDDDLDNSESADFIAWENSLIMLHHHVALLHHDIRMREHYVADRFGPPASQHAFGGRPPHGHPRPHSGPQPPCNDVSSFIGSVLHKITGTAKAIYGGWWPMPHCFPGSGRKRTGPPPPPAAPPSFLFHCPSSPPPPSKQGPHAGHSHDHQGPPQVPPHDGPHGHPHPDNEPHHPPHQPPHQEPPHEPHHDGPSEHGPGGPEKDGFHMSETSETKSHDHKTHDHDGPFPPAEWEHGPHPFGGPHEGDGPRRMHAPAIKMVAFSALILVLFLVVVRHCSNRRMQKRLVRRARRRARRARRSSGRGLFSSMRRFLSTRDEFYEKVADDEADIEGIPECSEVSRPTTPVASLEPEAAETAVAIDVVAVDVVEEVVGADEDSSSVIDTVETSKAQEIASFHQPSFTPPPPPPTTTASSVYSGYGRRDPVGIETDFDDTESLPPAYSSDDYAYVNMIEASVVADGFQYRPSSF
ncbi:hypothetical protein F503_04456 [Ophiostoma piceae UAMH 11346]|uniref:Uncharacterized protein n=1 Tax=Ophiostoma piceae (strain UAMH 11346) TaxID=1262450 RepID=S3C5R2_OPHP1|nr:hypothetical protein F503_04456 [Ophiostoma piceae UAMH 11346]